MRRILMMTDTPIDWTKPIQTKDGKPARVIATDIDSDYPIAVAFKSSPRMEYVHAFTQVGWTYSNGKNIQIVNVPERIQGWILQKS